MFCVYLRNVNQPPELDIQRRDLFLPDEDEKRSAISNKK